MSDGMRDIHDTQDSFNPHFVSSPLLDDSFLTVQTEYIDSLTIGMICYPFHMCSPSSVFSAHLCWHKVSV